MKYRLILILLLISSPCFGATIYVDGNLGGNCTGNYSIANRACTGSDGNAYKTISGAVSASSAGDTINIRSGTYQYTSTITVGKNLTIQGYAGDSTPICHYTTVPTASGDWENFYVNGNATVTFSGLKIRGTRDLGVDEDFGHVGVLSESGTTVTINNCEIYEFNHCGLKGLSKWWVKNSYIHDIGSSSDNQNDHGIYANGNFSLGNESIYEYNFFEKITGAGIHLYNGGEAMTYHIARYNIIKGGGSATGTTTWGVLLDGNYQKIYGNTIYGCGSGLMFYRDTSDNNEVKNNIFYGNSYDLAIDGNPGLSNISSYNYLGSTNACYGCSGSYAYLDDAPPNIRNTNNPFVSGSPSNWYDFRLTTGAGAINVGANLGIDNQNGLNPNDTTWPPSTLNQNSYGAWEIGAFVYGSPSSYYNDSIGFSIKGFFDKHLRGAGIGVQVQ